MPNYDYECKKCEKRFEIFQSMNDSKLTDCPEPDCDGEVRRLLGTGGGIIFKGAGFYQTDYRSSSYQAGAKADNSSSAPPAATPAPAAAPAPAAKSGE
ncbi:MAG: zinc ribbon domain-containing protein [Akkermansiaceae bacterium]|nr:zinc ribbon domain-containing protein [Akkermansiaceae bacterium]